MTDPTTTPTLPVNGGDLRRAGYECDYGYCPHTGPQLYAWAHANKRRHDDLVRRLRHWGEDNGHDDLLTVWTPEAVAAALRWLVETPETIEHPTNEPRNP